MRLLTIAANPPTVAWPAFKLPLDQTERTQGLPGSQDVLMPKDYINFELTGERRTDFCETSCSYMFDCQSRTWSARILELLGLDSDKLPSLSLASGVLGGVTKEAAGITGLRPGTPVAVGAGDFPMALLVESHVRGWDAISPPPRR